MASLPAMLYVRPSAAGEFAHKRSPPTTSETSARWWRPSPRPMSRKRRAATDRNTLSHRKHRGPSTEVMRAMTSDTRPIWDCAAFSPRALDQAYGVSGSSIVSSETSREAPGQWPYTAVLLQWTTRATPARAADRTTFAAPVTLTLSRMLQGDPLGAFAR